MYEAAHKSLAISKKKLFINKRCWLNKDIQKRGMEKNRSYLKKIRTIRTTGNTM